MSSNGSNGRPAPSTGDRRDPIKAKEANPSSLRLLACMPCRRRKSKCDRVQPCSSCVLRDTEKFCYTSNVSEEAPSLSNGKSEEKRKSISRSSFDTSSTSRPTKVKRTAERASFANAESGSSSSNTVKSNTAEREGSQDGVDRSAILAAIQSIQMTLTSLENSVGRVDKTNVHNDMVPSLIHWDEVKVWLPSAEDCETILDCFVDYIYLFYIVHGPHLVYHWRQFVAGKPTDRSFVALAIFCMGSALYMAPASHPASRLPYQKNHRSFMEQGYRILLPSDNPFTILTPSVTLVQAQLAFNFYLSMSGWLDQGYIEQGKMFRYARSVHLFDESKWNFSSLSDWDVELRRRLARGCVLIERWTSMYFLRPPVIPLDANVKPPDLHSNDSYDIHSGMLVAPSNIKPLQTRDYIRATDSLGEGAFRITHYLSNFTSMTAKDRYAAAKELDAFLLNVETQIIPPSLKFDNVSKMGMLSSPEAYLVACQSLLTYSSLKRQRCTVMRQFLLDREAPVELRVAALEHAKSIIETMPVLIAVSSSPWVAFNSSWCSSHLFCAASTFALVYLCEEDQQQSTAELDWFASKIFEVTDTLSALSEKDRVAKRCEELLIALCTSRDTLRAKFAASKTGMRQKGRQVGDTLTGEAGERDKTLITPYFATMPSYYDTLAPGEGVSEALHNGSSKRVSRSKNAAQTPQNAIPQPQQTNSSYSTSRYVQQSPDSYSSNPDTPAGRSSGSRTSIADDATDSTFWPPLDDGQWSALIDTLNGDWSTVNGASLTTNVSETAQPAFPAGMSAAPAPLLNGPVSSCYPWNASVAFPSLAP